MGESGNKRYPIIISEKDPTNGYARTTLARANLYSLIAQFRKDAKKADDPQTRLIFEAAAEIISGLANALKEYEVNLENENKEEI